MNNRSRQELNERASKLGRGIKYRYDGMVKHVCFDGNDNQWALIHNWDAKSFKTLGDIEAELTRLECSADQAGERHE